MMTSKIPTFLFSWAACVQNHSLVHSEIYKVDVLNGEG